MIGNYGLKVFTTTISFAENITVQWDQIMKAWRAQRIHIKRQISANLFLHNVAKQEKTFGGYFQADHLVRLNYSLIHSQQLGRARKICGSR